MAVQNLSNSAFAEAISPRSRLLLESWTRNGMLARWLSLSFACGLSFLMLVFLAADIAGPLSGHASHVPWHPLLGASEVFRIFLANLSALGLWSLGLLALFSLKGPTGQAMRPLARRILLWVVGFLLALALSRQIILIADQASFLSARLGLSLPALLAAFAPHSLIELTAIFLPAAAGGFLLIKGRGYDLAAAARLCFGFGAALLVLAAVLEVYLTPQILALLA